MSLDEALEGTITDLPDERMTFAQSFEGKLGRKADIRVADKFDEFIEILIQKGSGLRGATTNAFYASEEIEHLLLRRQRCVEGKTLALGEANIPPNGFAIISQGVRNLRDAVMIIPTTNDFPNVHDADLAKSHVCPPVW